MLFNSLHFLYFLPITFALYWLINYNWRWLLLLLASYFFYMCWNPWFGILLLATTLIDFYTALQIAGATNTASKKRWLCVSLISNIGCLMAFKYAAFFYNTSVFAIQLFSGSSMDTMANLIIPIGLSFYTFQSLGYTIDVYRGLKPETNPARFALFVSFFPQLVAGPVERYEHLMPQLTERKKPDIDSIIKGIRIATWGFFKKMVIADTLATIVNPVFSHVQLYSGLTLFICGFFFVIQVYCDFSGYSDIATGVARLFGIELILNWRRPLLSRSLIEFWKRNHISITSWFRNYLYIPLGGNKVPYRRWLLNIFLVFLISGLWHGANWTFVIWGSMHGLVYIVELIFKKQFPNLKVPGFIGWIYLITFHSLSLIAFRANNVQDLFMIYSKLFSFHQNLSNSLYELKKVNDLFPLLLSIILIGFLFLKELNEEHGWLNRFRSFDPILKPVFYSFVFVLIFVFGNFNANEFIYFHF